MNLFRFERYKTCLQIFKRTQSLYFAVDGPFNRIFKEFSLILDNINSPIWPNCLYYRSIETYIGVFIPFDCHLDGLFEGLCIPAVITVAIYIFKTGRCSKIYYLYIFLIYFKGSISFEAINILYR